MKVFIAEEVRLYKEITCFDQKELSEFSLSPQDHTVPVTHVEAVTLQIHHMVRDPSGSTHVLPQHAQSNVGPSSTNLDLLRCSDPFSQTQSLSLKETAMNNLTVGVSRLMVTGTVKGEDRKRSRFHEERERRIFTTDRFIKLKDLIPNPKRFRDRETIINDAIEHVKELLRTIEELKSLVEEKRHERRRSKRGRTEKGGSEDPENDTFLGCSWLRRESESTEVDARVIDGEVIIKLVQKKRTSCLLLVSKVLDQLHLDLHYVASEQIGENYMFLFKTKIYGSSVRMSAIANAVMEVAEQQYMDVIPTTDH